MHTKLLLTGTALAALSMIPSCPAPMLPALISSVIGGIVAPLAGGVVAIGLGVGGVFDVPQCCKAAKSVSQLQRIKMAARQLTARQSEDWPPGVSEESIEQCRVTNVGRQVTLTRTGEYCMLFLYQSRPSDANVL
jgi:hypothetical protein